MQLYSLLEKDCVDWVDRLKRPNRFYTIAVANAYCLISELQDVSADFPNRPKRVSLVLGVYLDFWARFQQISVWLRSSWIPMAISEILVANQLTLCFFGRN